MIIKNDFQIDNQFNPTGDKFYKSIRTSIESKDTEADGNKGQSVLDQVRHYEMALRQSGSDLINVHHLNNQEFLRESGISAASIGSKSVDRSMQLAATNDRLAKLE